MILSYGEVDNLRNRMCTERSRFIPTWRAQAEFMNPHYFREFVDRNDGDRKDMKILSTRARLNSRTFVSGMSNGNTPQAEEWFKLTVAKPKAANSSASRRYFTELEQIFNTHLQISNTYRVLPMSYKSLGTFSNSAFAMLPHARFGFFFYPFIVGSYGAARDSEGNANAFYRDFVMSVRQVVEMYGDLKPDGHIDWTNMDPWVKQLWDTNQYFENVMLTNVILPNKKPVAKSIHSHDKKFQSYTYVMASGGNNGGLPNQYNTGFREMRGTTQTMTPGSHHFISVKGYDYFPIIVNGWEVPPESDYGVDGPGEIALGDIQSINDMEYSKAGAIKLLLKPPMVGPSSLRRHQSSILAGGITYVDESSDTAKFRAAFEVDPKIDALINTMDRYEEAIDKAFYVDVFLKLQGQELKSHVSARAVDEVASEKLTAVGGLQLGQLDNDQNGPIISNMLTILGAQGKLPEAPEELQGEHLRPEYISPLAKAAKAHQAQSMEEFIQFVGGTAEMLQDPALLKLADGEKFVREYANFKAVNPNYVPSAQEFRKIKEAMAQAQANQKQLEQQELASKTAKNLSQSEIGGEKQNLLSLVGEQA